MEKLLKYCHMNHGVLFINRKLNYENQLSVSIVSIFNYQVSKKLMSERTFFKEFIDKNRDL
jgi:hypothetical protein